MLVESGLRWWLKSDFRVLQVLRFRSKFHPKTLQTQQDKRVEVNQGGIRTDLHLLFQLNSHIYRYAHIYHVHQLTSTKMPEIPVHPLSVSSCDSHYTQNPFPPLLQTPSGLAILEIQGTIHVPSLQDAIDEPNEEITQKETMSIGKLVFPYYSPNNPTEDTAWMKCVYMYIGKYQRMTGEVKKLPKALAILKRKESKQQDAQEELEIVDVAKYKIIFSQRPEPVS